MLIRGEARQDVVSKEKEAGKELSGHGAITGIACVSRIAATLLL